jgi:hypothetical protein
MIFPTKIPPFIVSIRTRESRGEFVCADASKGRIAARRRTVRTDFITASDCTNIPDFTETHNEGGRFFVLEIKGFQGIFSIDFLFLPPF